MSEKIANIARNTSFFTFALILQKIISFTYFTLLARGLGPEDLGKYYFAISFTTIFAIFIDLGFTNYLTRESAKRQDEAGKILGRILGIKIPLASITLLAVILAINFLGYGEISRHLVYLSSISMVLDSFTTTFFAAIRGFHNLKYESIGSVVFQSIVLLIGISVLFSGLDLRWQIVALALASLYNFIFSAVIAAKIFKIDIKPVFDWLEIRKIIFISLPFSFFAILQRLYTYLDTVLLSKLSGDMAVGLYQVPFKIIFALQFMPMAFTASLYPAMSIYWSKNKDQLAVTFERAMNYLIFISLPISFGTIVLADKIILIFKAGYADAILPLQITMLSVIFNFISFPIGSLLNACDRQKENTRNMSIVLAVSVIMNIILIPEYGAVGACITVTSTNALMVVLGLMVVPKITRYSGRKILKILLKCFLAVSVMGFVIFFLKSYLNILLVVIIAAFIYFTMLFILRAFTKEDMRSIIHSFKKAGQ